MGSWHLDAAAAAAAPQQWKNAITNIEQISQSSQQNYARVISSSKTFKSGV